MSKCEWLKKETSFCYFYWFWKIKYFAYVPEGSKSSSSG